MTSVYVVYSRGPRGLCFFFVAGGHNCEAPNKESHLLVRASQLAATCQFRFVKAAVLVNTQANTDWSIESTACYRPPCAPVLRAYREDDVVADPILVRRPLLLYRNSNMQQQKNIEREREMAKWVWDSLLPDATLLATTTVWHLAFLSSHYVAGPTCPLRH